MSGRYLTRRRLEELDRTLSAKDKAILRSLWDCRYLCTGQIRRLHYSGSTNPAAGLRAASWGTAKLRGFGLIDILERRVGGVRAGSKSYIWSLTESGVNLLNIKNTDSPLRRRSFEPSMNFMRHTLAVSEVFVQLTEICQKHGLELVRTEMEPGCWRPYTGEDKKPAAMKPDMFAVTGDGEFEDSWFIEVDMNTESPSVIMEKCRRYSLYRRSGIEQKQNGVFPLVLWIAYSANRKAKLRQCIADSREIPETDKGIFTVILPEEFEPLICNGADTLAAQEGEQAS